MSVLCFDGKMKRYSIPFFTLLLVSFSAYSEKKQIKLCYENVELKPFYYGTDKIPEKPGYIVDLVELAVKSAGAQAILYRQPWKRCILNVTRGEMDGLFSVIKTPEREKWAEFPTQKQSGSYLLKISYPIYVKRGSHLTWSDNQFNGVRFGVAAPPGYVARNTLIEKGVYPKGEQDLDLSRGLRMVALGRLDGYVVNKTTGDKMIEQLGLENQITTLPTPFIYEYLNLAFSKPFFEENKECSEKIWQQIETIRKKHGKDLFNSYQSNSNSALTVEANRGVCEG